MLSRHKLTQCSCAPRDKWAWYTCCPCTSWPNFHQLASQLSRWSCCPYTSCPCITSSQKSWDKFWVNLSTDNMFNEHLLKVNLCKVNMLRITCHEKPCNIATTCAFDNTSFSFTSYTDAMNILKKFHKCKMAKKHLSSNNKHINLYHNTFSQFHRTDLNK